MKITKQRLRQLIKEEVERALREGLPGGSLRDDCMGACEMAVQGLWRDFGDHVSLCVTKGLGFYDAAFDLTDEQNAHIYRFLGARRKAKEISDQYDQHMSSGASSEEAMALVCDDLMRQVQDLTQEVGQLS